MTDEELINGCILNIDKFITKFYNKYHKNIKNKVCKYIKNEDDINDLIQLSFIKIYKNLKSFKGDYLYNWMFMITRNTCIDFIRQQKSKNNNIIYFDDNIDYLIYDDNSSDTIIERNELYDKLNKCINKLSPMYKKCLHKHYFEKMSFKEIGIELNITESSAKSNCCKARKNIKKHFLF